MIEIEKQFLPFSSYFKTLKRPHGFHERTGNNHPDGPIFPFNFFFEWTLRTEMITSGCLTPIFLRTAQPWSGLLFLTAVSSLGHWTSSSFQSCCTQRGSDGGLVARTWLEDGCYLDSKVHGDFAWILQHLVLFMDPASHQKTTRLSRFLPQRFDLPHPAQEIPLQTIYFVKMLASESLVPAQEIILLQKNLWQDSCLRESTCPQLKKFYCKRTMSRFLPQLKKLKKTNLVWISEPHWSVS